MKEYSKEKIIYEQREVHGEHRKAEIIHKAMPDMSAKVSVNGIKQNFTSYIISGSLWQRRLGTSGK